MTDIYAMAATSKNPPPLSSAPWFSVNPDIVAKDIYDYWCEIMKSDGLLDAAEMGWDELPTNFQELFAEAVRIKAIQPAVRSIKDLQDKLDECRAALAKEVARTLDRMAKPGSSVKPTPVQTYDCYQCGQEEVLAPGATCPSCAKANRGI